MNLKEILDTIREKLGLNGTFKWAVFGSLVTIIIGILILCIDHALYVAAGYEVGSPTYVFQMATAALMGIVLPGVLLGLCIFETHKLQKPFLTGIIVTGLSIFLIVIASVFMGYAAARFDDAVTGHFVAIFILISVGIVMFVLCLMDGIKNIREGKSSSE